VTPRRGGLLALLLLGVLLGPLAPAAYASTSVPTSTGGPVRETVSVAAVPAAATDTSVLALGAITPPWRGRA
jgi:hypothetical protein